MRRTLTAASISLGAVVIAAAPAFAQEGFTVEPPLGLGGLEFGDIITFLINIAFVIAAILALVYLIWGGINWITSSGDSEAVGNARNKIIAAIIGLVVVILSYFVLNFVLSDILGVGNLQDGLQFNTLCEQSGGSVNPDTGECIPEANP